MKKLSLITSLYLLLSPGLVFAQSVDILYQGNTYTPPFYRGAALWSGESKVTLFAVPQGLGNPANLLYKWRRGTLVLGELTSAGKNTMTFTDDIFSKTQNFSVEIVADDENRLATAFISLKPQMPELLVYEKNPLYGFLFNREVSDAYRIREEEATLAIFPLFFDSLGREGDLMYEWRSSANVDSAKSEVTYRVSNEASGSASASVKVSKPSTIRQVAGANFLIQFGNEK